MTGRDELDIRSGTVVAVETEALREAARCLRQAEAECVRVREGFDRISALLREGEVWVAPPLRDAEHAARRAGSLAAGLDTMCDTYEVIELEAAARLAEAGGDLATARHVRARIMSALGADPLLFARVALATVTAGLETTRALAEQYGVPLPGGITLGTSPLASFGRALIAGGGWGAVPRGTTLDFGDVGERAEQAVHTQRLAGGRATAPTSLSEMVDRMPKGEGRVRVERYTMSDGSRRFAVYVAGTAGGGDDDEAWDFAANLDLYPRKGAASYEAVRAALADAGAEPGDSVLITGHSQGAMIGSFLTLSGEYDVPMLVTWGSPVQAEVDERTLSVAVRHRDDPVSALSGDGFAARVGAPGSFVASRETPGVALTGEGLIGQHELRAYRETAGLLDASTDPRMSGVREQFAQLQGAVSVEAIVYAAARDRPPVVTRPRPEITPTPPPTPMPPARGSGGV